MADLPALAPPAAATRREVQLELGRTRPIAPRRSAQRQLASCLTRARAQGPPNPQWALCLTFHALPIDRGSPGGQRVLLGRTVPRRCSLPAVPAFDDDEPARREMRSPPHSCPDQANRPVRQSSYRARRNPSRPPASVHADSARLGPWVP